MAYVRAHSLRLVDGDLLPPSKGGGGYELVTSSQLRELIAPT